MRTALIEARKRCGLTQEQLAQKLGISRRQMLAVEHGESAGSMGLWIRIKAALNLHSDELMECMKTDSMRISEEV